MIPVCTECTFSTISYVQGRERVGCHRSRLLPDGKVMKPPADGFEAVIERLPQVDLDWRAPGDKCSTEGKHFRRTD